MVAKDPGNASADPGGNRSGNGRGGARKNDSDGFDQIGQIGWANAIHAAMLVAVDPVGLGGTVLRARCGPQRDHWLAALRALLPAGTPVRRLPLHIGDEGLLGGLDLSATLHAGRPVARRGVLAEADGGVVLLAMAERLPAATAARLARVLDSAEVLLERDGLATCEPARLGLIVLDEGIEDDEQAPAALADRLAFHLFLDELPARGLQPLADTRASADTEAARALLARVTVPDDAIEALCHAALTLGVDSLRAPWLALRAARAAAALDGRDLVDNDDLALAAQLVLAPRATRLPADADADQAPPPEPAPPEPPKDQDNPPDEPPPDDADAPQEPLPDQPLDDVILEAALASLPAGLLARLKAGLGPRQSSSGGGKHGAMQIGRLRGRPIGARRGELRAGARLDLIATLRAAAPWQGLRRREALAARAHLGALAPTTPEPRVRVRRDDFHIARMAQRRETTTVFVVDASGSAALHRLAEAKGAVELLLADCYVRRDRVALIAFRGASAELLLAPTRSLVRAKRSLAGLPGGGGTPLASALDAAGFLAEAIVRRGGTPVIALLTDGRANIARDGTPGREAALADALLSARMLRSVGAQTLMVDTSPRSSVSGSARQLADAMGAQYLLLPQADAAGLSRAVQAAQRA
jgi:magnesium chelatase subunit D